MTFVQNCKLNLNLLLKTKIIHIFIYISLAITIIGKTLATLKINELKLFTNYPSLLFLTTIIIQSLVLLSAIFIFKYHGNILNTLGLNKFKPLKSSLSILLGFLAYFSIVILISLLNISIPGFGEQQNYLIYFGNDKFSLAVSIITVVILAPIIEEIFFRGYLFSILSNLYSPTKINLITSIIFASIHLQLNVIIPLFILGYIIGNIRIKTNSAIPCIIFHAINNGLALSAQYYKF